MTIISDSTVFNEKTPLMSPEVKIALKVTASLFLSLTLIGLIAVYYMWKGPKSPEPFQVLSRSPSFDVYLDDPDELLASQPSIRSTIKAAAKALPKEPSTVEVKTPLPATVPLSQTGANRLPSNRKIATQYVEILKEHSIPLARGCSINESELAQELDLAQKIRLWMHQLPEEDRAVVNSILVPTVEEFIFSLRTGSAS